jgi:hypothetical protein
MHTNFKNAIRILATGLTIIATSPNSLLAQQIARVQPQAAAKYGKLSLSFEANHGQADSTVKFLSRGNGCVFYFTETGSVLALANRSNTGHELTSQGRRFRAAGTRSTDVLRMELVDANFGSSVTGAGQLPGTANYFIGNDPARWQRNVPTYAKVKYGGVYPGVDMVYHGNQDQLEYDFVVAPGANARAIQLHFDGAKRLELTLRGDLTVSGAHGQIAFHKPLVYQLHNGRRRPIPGRFTLRAKNDVGFSLGSYDQSKVLVIDPVLVYSSYLGGSVLDAANAIAVDKAGNAYLAGSASSPNFPVTRGAFQTTDEDPLGDEFNATFIAKLNSSGTALVYSTYLGAANCSTSFSFFSNGLLTFPPHGLAVDDFGDAYVTGSPCSAHFPVTKGAFQTTNPSGGATFVTKLSPNGSELVYSTFLGGGGGDQSNALALDGSGNVFITGTTGSTNFPVTKGAFQRENRAAAVNNSTTGFVSKLNSTGSDLVYSTYLGGSGGFLGGFGDIGNAIALDRSGSAYIAGLTYSPDFPVTKGAFQTRNKGITSEFAGNNAFLTKLNSTGTGLIYSTYLGGSQTSHSPDSANAVAVDGLGNAYVAGSTSDDDFPITKGAFQTKNKAADLGQYPGNDAFVTKLDPTGSELVYSTFLGGSGLGRFSDGAGGDAANALALDDSGHAYVAGVTESTNFPITSGAFQTTNRSARRGVNAFVTELNQDGSELVYSTYLGGTSQDYADALALDDDGNVYVGGAADSIDFPISKSAFQRSNHGTGNAFVAKLSLGEKTTATATTLASSANPQIAGHPVTFTAIVVDRDTSSIPSGIVEFFVEDELGNETTFRAKLNSAGNANFTTSALAAGIYTVTASYCVLSSSFGPSISKTLTETITTPRHVEPTTLSPTEVTYDSSKSVTMTGSTRVPTSTARSTK